MYQDFKDLLSAFHARGVKYLIVGGYAVILHAQPRATKDIDLLIQTDPENAHAIFKALADFGLPLGDIKPEDFADRGSFFRFGHDPQTVDILSEIPASTFSMRGGVALKVLSIRRQACQPTSFRRMTFSCRRSRRGDRRIWRMPRRFGKQSSHAESDPDDNPSEPS